REKERLQMLYWLKTGKVSTRKELTERLCRNEATSNRWLKKRQESKFSLRVPSHEKPEEWAL
ncbi:MAG: hypothetical protein J7524_22630, partial [Roseofilum sp. Belize BBD 4]|nr:hypothetical protein [Roseofilum sp. Belize BBD 4]